MKWPLPMHKGDRHKTYNPPDFSREGFSYNSNYRYYGESDHSRSFYIDSNYHIYTYDEWMFEGENGAADIEAGPVNEITINSKGVFTTKVIKKQRPLN
ncbi:MULTISPECIES: hypothetical protein [Niastella]|uniref:Uncharacterized protein n=1 Tax=Niastella soli TaxID=2821487 RepID=A0ABS3Z6Y0_9BACT|nr:hypothetical protein [Niastella soli]MBO9205435.1 hypothetical protein [Niastella soli]